MRSAMPNRTYRGRTPPTALDHFYAHPFETLISLGTLLAGLVIAAVELGAPVTVSPTLNALPAVVSWLVALTAIGGNALVLAGIFDNGADLHRGWRLERLGIVGVVTCWLTYSTAVASLFHESVISYGLPALVGAAYLTRFVATVKEDQAARASIATLPPEMQC